jgi:prolyl oligopeptidase
MNNKLLIRYLQDGSHIYKVYDLQSTPAKFIKSIKMPGLGSVHGIFGKHNQSDFFFKFESFLDPGSVYKVDLNSFITKTLYKTKLPKGAPDMNDFKTDRLYYKSKDGTRVPMFIIRKKSILKSIYSQPQ